LLGALDGFSDLEKVEYADLPSLEKWVLHRLAQLDALRKACLETYDFKTFYAELHTFCASELSSLYFDIRKDCLYCDDPKSLKRKAVRTVMDLLFDTITCWLAPVLCFTAEEAYLERYPDKQSIHLENMMDIPEEWINESLGDTWYATFDIRRHITSALELKRVEKFIGSSLQAKVSLTLPTHLYDFYVRLQWDEISIVSQAEVLEGEDIKVEVQLAEGQKCERCWKIKPEVTDNQQICNRCNEVVTRI
jgi:isoleucyl-tRNA synthetase